MTPTSLPALADRLLHPGRQWMQRLTLRSKLLLLAAVLAIPATALLTQQLASAARDLSALHDQQAAVALVDGLHGLQQRVQALRQAERLAATNANANASDRAALRSAVVQAGQAVQPQLAAHPGWAGPAAAPALQAALARYAPGAPPSDPAGHDALLQQLRATVAAVSEQLHAAVDTVPVNRQLWHLGVEQLVLLDDEVWRLQDLATGLAGRSQATPQDRWRATEVLDRARQRQAETGDRLQALTAAGAVVPASWHTLLSARQQVERAMLAALDQPGPAAAQAMQPLAEAVARLQQDLLGQLRQRLDQQAPQRRLQLALSLGAQAASVLLALYLGLAFYQSFTASLNSLHQAVQALSQGDLTRRVDIRGDDELAAAGAELEQTVQMLSSLVAEIRTSAVRVDRAGEDVAQDRSALTLRADQESGDLHQASQAVRQLSTTVAGTTQALGQLDERARELGSQGQECLGTMTSGVDALGQLTDSVRRVAEINAVIDDIAFQTNLLSINASVEAARAGESGKGFGVVAAEVRDLSLRCAQAAAEVRTLIDQTAGHVDTTRDHIGVAHGQLGELVRGVGQVAGGLQQAAQAGQAQGESLDALAQSVARLDGLARDKQDTIGAAARASESLAEQAQALRVSVATMRLRQGGADEAQALVQRATDLMAAIGWDQAVREFHRRGGPFIERDMYIFAFDADGRYLAMGGRPEVVGQRLEDLPQMTAQVADRFLEAARSTAAAGGGWMDYDWVDVADGNRLLHKSAYVVPLGDGAFLGCGVHRWHADGADHTTRTALPAEAEAEAAWASP